MDPPSLPSPSSSTSDNTPLIPSSSSSSSSTSTNTYTSPPATTQEWEIFRQQGKLMVDFIADYYLNLANQQYPVKSSVTPGYLAKHLSSEISTQPESFTSIMHDIQQHIIPGITHWQSPNFYGYFPANTSPPSLLGDMLSGAFGIISFSWIASPAATELETIVMNYLVSLLNLPSKFHSKNTGGGVIQGTASEATLVALLGAKTKMVAKLTSSSSSTTTTPSNTSTNRFVAYMSDQAHSSVKKACMIAGLDSSQIRIIPTKGPLYQLDSNVLETIIQQDINNQYIPFFCVSTSGTTSSGAFDPLEFIGKVCEKYNIWLHVDSAWAGSALICPEYRSLFTGLEYVESFAFNPHKWLRTNFDCCAMFVTNRYWLLSALSITPEYLKSKEYEQGLVSDYRDWSIPLGRRFRSLKLWFVLRMYGIENLQNQIRYHCSLANLFTSLVNTDERLEIPVPISLALVCFRLRKSSDKQSIEEWNQKNELFLSKIMESSTVYLVHTKLDGIITLRLAIGSPLTQEIHIHQTWKIIQQALNQL